MTALHFLSPSVLRRKNWKNRRVAATLLCSLIGSSLMIGGTRPVFAEDVKPKTQPQQPNDEEYVIGQDDVITIVSPGHEELTQLAIVQPDGRITVAGMDGTIKAEGKTLLQLKREIFTGLDKLYNNLQLTVGLKEFNSRTVTMVGGRTGGRFRPRRKPGVFLRS